MSDLADGLAARLSCADSTFPRLSHDGALAVISDLGLPAVDICVFAGYEHNPPERVLADPRRAADAVNKRLASFGLAASDVFAILDTEFDRLAVNHPDASVRREAMARFGGILEFATQLGSPGLTLLPGTKFEGVGREESLGLAASELQRRAELAREAGIALSIEPHYGSVADTPERALALCAQAPDLSLALDYSHFVYQGIEQAEVDPLIVHARHLHLRQAGPGVMQAPIHEGAIDFPRLLDRLEAAGYEGYLALEYQNEEWLGCNRVDCISETALLRDMIRAHEAGR